MEPAGHGAVGAGEPEANAEVTRRVLAGEPGTERAMTVLNAGAAIYVGGRAESVAAGVRAAEESIDSGAAREVLAAYVRRSRELAG